MGGVNNPVVTPPAVPANTSGGNPWPTTSPYSGLTPDAGVTIGSAGDAHTLSGGHFPSPGVNGVDCSIGDIWDEIGFKVRATRTLPEPKTRTPNPNPKPEPQTLTCTQFMGSGFEPTTQGTHNADALRDGCPLSCGTCPQSFYHQSTKTGTCQSSACKTFFTMSAHPSPPPPPRGPGYQAPQWEVPIIQAFKGSFGLDEIKHGPGPYGTTVSSTSTVSTGMGGGSPSSGLNCDYVCHVYRQSNGVVGGRRLLFGGLQSYSGVDTNVFVGCSQDMRDCNCCPEDIAAGVAGDNYGHVG